MSLDSCFDERLEQLCILAGILPAYQDCYGQEHGATVSTKQHVLRAMGLACDNATQLLESIDRLELAPWRRLLPPVLVQPQSSLDGIPLSLPAHDAEATFTWKLTQEDSSTLEGNWHIHEYPSVDGREVDGIWRERRIIRFEHEVPLGYHRLLVQYAGHSDTTTEMRWIITPERCYLPENFEQEKRVFGIAVQLYSLRDLDDWGVGNFGTVQKFVHALKNSGVALIGLNPLHELSPSHPEASSPYSPSSRLTLNPIYLDVTAIPDFAESEHVRALYYHPELVVRRAEAREREIIDYAPIVLAKRRILEACFESFQQKHLAKDTKRSRQYQQHLAEGGSTLARLCTFNALSEKFTAESMTSWHEWPAPYRNVNSNEVLEFAKQEHERLRFFAYVQWEIQRQLSMTQEACHEMPIGMYCDLAVGVDSQSADTWAQPELFAQGIGVGAPPDQLCPEGQGWGLVPFSPLALYEDGYTGFSALLRANMRHIGALRIDHAMLLLRLYWIPDNAPPSEGAYVLYRVDDLFHILALESRRAQCVIIGEDLGTIPDGFRDRLRNANLLSYRLLRFEREYGGKFIAAENYPRLALAGVGTHDLPPLAGFWHGDDILTRGQFGWVTDRNAEETERAHERERFLHFLISTGDLSPDDAASLWGEPHEDQDLEPFITAAYRFIARTPSLIAMVQAEDLIGMRSSVNIPGTTNQHPNWRRRLPLTVDELAHAERTQRLLNIMRSMRTE